MYEFYNFDIKWNRREIENKAKIKVVKVNLNKIINHMINWLNS